MFIRLQEVDKVEILTLQDATQIIDVVNLFAPICKMSKQIVHGNNIPALVREAFRVAEEERPGAVLLEVPEDIAV